MFVKEIFHLTIFNIFSWINKDRTTLKPGTKAITSVNISRVTLQNIKISNIAEKSSVNYLRIGNYKESGYLSFLNADNVSIKII